jgi:hypothetical protein
LPLAILFRAYGAATRRAYGAATRRAYAREKRLVNGEFKFPVQLRTPRSLQRNEMFIAVAHTQDLRSVGAKPVSGLPKEQQPLRSYGATRKQGYQLGYKHLAPAGRSDEKRSCIET